MLERGALSTTSSVCCFQKRPTWALGPALSGELCPLLFGGPQSSVFLEPPTWAWVAVSTGAPSAQTCFPFRSRSRHRVGPWLVHKAEALAFL